MNSRMGYLCLLVFLLTSCSRNINRSIAREATFTPEETEMIMSAEATAPMRVFKINNHSDSLLLRTRSSAVPVRPDDPVLNHFVKRLYATVRDSMSLGLGIAAPQVGILKNIIWVQRFDKEGAPFEVYLNPKIVQYSQKTITRQEGCLSIPDRRETLNCRSYAILIEYDKLDGTHHLEMSEDLSSIIFQHEVDHLDGILYLDHLKKEIEDAKSQ